MVENDQMTIIHHFLHLPGQLSIPTKKINHKRHKNIRQIFQMWDMSFRAMSCIIIEKHPLEQSYQIRMHHLHQKQKIAFLDRRNKNSNNLTMSWIACRIKPKHFKEMLLPWIKSWRKKQQQQQILTHHHIENIQKEKCGAKIIVCYPMHGHSRDLLSTRTSMLRNVFWLFMEQNAKYT